MKGSEIQPINLFSLSRLREFFPLQNISKPAVWDLLQYRGLYMSGICLHRIEQVRSCGGYFKMRYRMIKMCNVKTFIWCRNVSAAPLLPSKLMFIWVWLARPEVCNTLLHHVKAASAIVTPKRVHTQWEAILLEKIGVRIQAPVVRRGRWVVWEKPSQNFLKLNTDGSRKRQVATGGGVACSGTRKVILFWVLRSFHA